MPGPYRLPILLTGIALATQRGALRFQFILNEAESRQHHRVPQRLAR